jgi:hypothetical protein
MNLPLEIEKVIRCREALGRGSLRCHGRMLGGLGRGVFVVDESAVSGSLTSEPRLISGSKVSC